MKQTKLQDLLSPLSSEHVKTEKNYFEEFCKNTEPEKSRWNMEWKSFLFRQKSSLATLVFEFPLQQKPLVLSFQLYPLANCIIANNRLSIGNTSSAKAGGRKA